MSYPRPTLYLAFVHTARTARLYLAYDLGDSETNHRFRLDHRDAANVMWFVDDGDAIAYAMRTPFADDVQIEAAIEPWRPTGLLVSSGLIVVARGGSTRVASELLRYE